MKQSEWLNYFSSKFDSVEVNATFYRLPKPDYVAHWAAQTTQDFLFAVKGSRYLTHMKRMRETGEAVDRFFDLVSLLGDKLGPVLWQLPPTMECDLDRLAAFAGALPAAYRHAFEFRHPSWYSQEVYDVLERAGAALCIPDHPDLPGEIRLTAGWTYLRLHYGDGRGGSYTGEELRRWAQLIEGYNNDGVDVYAYFNNDQEGFAVANAAELAGMLEF